MNLKNRGVTLVEAIVVLFLVSIIFVSLTELNAKNIYTNKVSKDKYNMFLIAFSLCEMYRCDDNYFDEKEYVIYINDDDILYPKLLDNINVFSNNNNKKYKIVIDFEKHIDKLYSMKVVVKDDINKNEIVTLKCYK